MNFEEAYGGWQERRLTQEGAARLLGGCERTFRRFSDSYEEEGLIVRRLIQVSHRRAPEDAVLGLVEQYRRRHDGWSAKHVFARCRRDAQESREAGRPWQTPGAQSVTGDVAAPERFDP